MFFDIEEFFSFFFLLSIAFLFSLEKYPSSLLSDSSSIVSILNFRNGNVASDQKHILLLRGFGSEICLFSIQANVSYTKYLC